MALAQLAVADHKACQKPAELAVVLALLAANPPKLVVEIGVLNGGTVWAWSRVAHSTATIVGVDLDAQDYGCNVKSGQTYIPVQGDSTAPETIARVVGLCDGHKPDLTFIDGDHSDEVVAQDLENYRGWVTAIHDITWPLDKFFKGLHGVEIVEDRDRDDGWGPWGGIGLLL